MIDTPEWQFEIDVHPPGWVFPAGQSWVVGWLWLKAGHVVRDVRVWMDGRPCLALHGLPRPEHDARVLGRPGPPYTGFYLLLAPSRSARLLRFEVRDETGSWREFHRTAITGPGDTPAVSPPVPAAPLDRQLAELLPRLLRLRTLRPRVSLRTLADDAIAGTLAQPLNSLPNPPFFGALEEPRDLGWVRYGRILINGWLAHRTARITRLTVMMNGGPAIPLYFGRARPDIAGIFADLPREAQVQFIGHAEVALTTDGPALLTLFAELENGEKHLAFAQRFLPRVIAGANTPFPPPSRLTFASALWALRGAARRHDLPLGPTKDCLAAAREAWTACRAEAQGRPRRPRPAAPPAPIPAAKPLRLLVVTHNLNFEGAPRLLFELSRYLGGAPGSAVRVLSPQEGPMLSLFEAAGMAVEVVDVSTALRADTPEKFHSALAAAVQPDWSAIDLVVANTMVSFWAVHLAVAARKPVLLYVHESAPIRRLFAPFLSPALFPLVESAFRAATRVVFTADASRQIFAYLDRHDRFCVRPSWLDVTAIDTFIATHSRAALRAKHGISPEALVVLNLGAVCERKGQHTFIAAAALLAPELRDRPIEFALVGARDDDFTALLRLQVAEVGLGGIRFVAETRENFDWLRLADILVCSSFEESSPRVITEAAAFGLPIVSTNVNGIPELVTDREAWLVEPGQPAQLAAAMRAALAAHTAGDTTRPTRARQIVLERFDARVSLPQHLALANEAAAAYP